MHPLISQRSEETQPEAPRNDTPESNSVVFEGKGRVTKRKLDVEYAKDLACIDQSNECRLDALAVMEGSSNSAQSPTPSNGIIRPINNQMKTNIATNNHFHQAGRSSSMTSYPAKSSQTKKLVIKNFKGDYAYFRNKFSSNKNN